MQICLRRLYYDSNLAPNSYSSLFLLVIAYFIFDHVYMCLSVWSCAYGHRFLEQPEVFALLEAVLSL